MRKFVFGLVAAIVLAVVGLVLLPPQTEKVQASPPPQLGGSCYVKWGHSSWEHTKASGTDDHVVTVYAGYENNNLGKQCAFGSSSEGLFLDDTLVDSLRRPESGYYTDIWKNAAMDYLCDWVDWDETESRYVFIDGHVVNCTTEQHNIIYQELNPLGDSVGCLASYNSVEWLHDTDNNRMVCVFNLAYFRMNSNLHNDGLLQCGVVSHEDGEWVIKGVWDSINNGGIKECGGKIAQFLADSGRPETGWELRLAVWVGNHYPGEAVTLDTSSPSTYDPWP